jgi:aspartyl protease family protein
VALTAETASQLGLTPQDYDVPMSTANGISYAAHVTLRHLQIGEINLYDVPASVAKPGALSNNLIGMSALKRLRMETTTAR